MSQEERIAVVDGLRSPFTKAWTSLNGVDAVELSTVVTRELLFRNSIEKSSVDHIVWGTVIAVPLSPNIAREVALNLSMYRTPGFTVTRACATGLQAIASAQQMILGGAAEIVVAGGVDVTSNSPVLHKKKVVDTLQKAQRAKGMSKLTTMASLRPMDFFPTPPSLKERYTGLTMGQHAEEMAQGLEISREAQEAFAIASHSKATKAVEAEHLAGQVTPIHTMRGIVDKDNLIRQSMKIEKLQSMRPVFDRKHGTITAATSSALTDGAAAVLLMKESKANALGLKPLGYIKSYSFPALDPRENMLLGNVYAIPEALRRANLSLKDIDLLEIHEAFAAQALSNIKLFSDDDFFKHKLPAYEPLGDFDENKINIWGGSLAYGHPFAATGCRLVTQLLHGLKSVDGRYGLATACAAGGLGSAMVLERV